MLEIFETLKSQPPSYYLGVTYTLYVFILTAIIIADNKEPQVTIGWILSIMFLPYVGVVFYLLSGIDWKKHKIVKYRPEELFQVQLDSAIAQQKAFLAEVPSDFDNDVVKSIRLNLSTSGGITTLNNGCDIFHGGEDAFGALFEDLKKAEKFIHMEHFIWRSDALGESIAAILMERVAAGVQVRLIFDGVGCFWTMKWKYKRMLKTAGVEFRTFLEPMSPLSGRLLNYRNHRKITVIDGQIAYCGGMNMGEEYITGGKRFDSWRDTQFRIRGEAVQMLEGVFLSDWGNSGGLAESPEAYFPEVEENIGYLPTQIICSGPDSQWHSIKQFIFNMICNANREVIIQSPYFIPDESLLNALTTAAMSGIRVRFMMTGKVDKNMPYWAAQTYFEPLLQAGVEIYLYKAGFMHAKVYIADNEMASLGTCNMDIRSLHLHYEVNAVFYDNDTVEELRAQFEKDTESCIQLTLNNLHRRNWLIRFRNSLFRVVSPVL